MRRERRKGAGHSAAAPVSMDLPTLSWVLKLGLHSGMKLAFRGWGSNEEERGLCGCLLRFLHMKGWGKGGGSRILRPGSMMTYLSLQEGAPES